MLLKALFNRLGSSSSTSPSGTLEVGIRFAKATYNRFPPLAILIEDMLHESCRIRETKSHIDQTSRQIQNAFPAMEVVNRLGVKRERQDYVEILLIQQLHSPVWILRDKAARTLIPLVDGWDFVREIIQSPETLDISQNELHGRLLCLKIFVEKIHANDIGLWEFSEQYSLLLTV